jgi:tetratricopeptide (TPR) repeat protein
MASFERARALYEHGNLTFRLVIVEQQISILHSSRGYAATGLAAAERALQGAARIEIALDLLGNCVLAQASALRALGRHAQALAAIERCLPQLIEAGIGTQARLQVELAQIYVELGRPDRAQRLAAAVREGGRLPPGELPRLVALELQLRSESDPQPALALVNDEGIEARRRCELLRLLAPSAQQPHVLLDRALRAATEADLPHERATARALLARELARAGQAGAATELMRSALADNDLVPAGYPPAIAECAVEVFTAAGDIALAQRALSEATAWIERARQDLPEEFRTSFVQRNEVNRRLIALAERSRSERASG